MADFSFSDDAELRLLNDNVVRIVIFCPTRMLPSADIVLQLKEPEDFEHWEKLVRAAESQEGGLNRNSSPGAIASTREVYDRFLARFPLFFGYWKKYADLEFNIAGTEAAELVYERGVASIGTSVDLWTNYCTFKIETNHDPDMIRELFQRAADAVGLDFLSHPFWDKYVEYEERNENPDQIFAILGRVIHLPMHQYARYYEHYTRLAPSRSISELGPESVVALLTTELQNAGETDVDNTLRARLDAINLEVFQRTQSETTKRWTYESEIKRPYYHVTDLDEAQLANWRKYLDFEELQGDYSRTKFLYERCLVTAANYDEFWLRYVRWMHAQNGKEEEVRSILQRASCIFVPIAQPEIRLKYAAFEESVGRISIAVDIHEAILLHLTNHVETIISLSQLHNRQDGAEAAAQVLRQYIDNPSCSSQARGSLVAELARSTASDSGDPDVARKIWQKNEPYCLNSRTFWISWLMYEVNMTHSVKDQDVHHETIKSVFDSIRLKSQLPPATIRDLAVYYLNFLKERGGKNAMKEYMVLDRELFGPFSVQGSMQSKLVADGQGGLPQPRNNLENGHPAINANEHLLRQSNGAYNKDIPQPDRPVAIV